MLIKICGFTRPDDARRAVEAGATAIGMVFWAKSPRAVTLAQAEAVAAAVSGDVLTVGVFVDATRDEIDYVMRRVPLGAAQLHGHESPAFVDTLPWPVIKAVAVPPVGPLPDLAPWAGLRVLLDAHDPVRRGGTGQMVDWARAAALAATRPVILAGGLRPDNVADVVMRVRPAGIDVSSGVEHSPGVKDEARVRALIGAVRAVEAS
jgi:phosphoribosylanthranilate isomerase